MLELKNIKWITKNISTALHLVLFSYSTKNSPDKSKQSGTDDEPLKYKETETTPNSTETIVPVGTTVEDMTSNKGGSTSDEKIKQLVHETRERSEESTIADSGSSVEENIEGSLEDEKESCSHEVAVVAGNLVGEDAVENLEQGQTGVSTVEDQLMLIKGETTSSTESVITDRIDADDSEIKEVVIEDEPRERDNSSSVRPADDTNQETSKNDNTGMPEEKEEICERNKTTTVETVIESGEVLEEDKKIHQDEDIPKCSASGSLDVGKVVSKFQSSLTDPSETNDRGLEKHEQNKRVAAGRQISDSVSATVEQKGIERTHAEQEAIVDKAIAVQNLADNFEGEKESDGIHDLVSLVKVNGKKTTGLDSSLSYHLPIVNEEKVQTEVNEEELVAAMIATPSSLQLAEDFDKGDIKPDSSDSNEGTITSTYEAKTINEQEIMNSSQCDHPQQIPLEEPEVVKFENSEILSTCIQSVQDSSTAGIIFTNGPNKERESASATAIGFTFESNQEKVKVTVGFTPESNQEKTSTNADKASEERCLLQTPTPGRDAGEGTPLLQRAENMSSFSHSTEQHSKVVEDIPTTNIALMQAKDEAQEESEKSPFLSPRGQSEGDFRAPNHSARNKEPLQSLMTEDRVGMWSPLKEQEPVPKNNTMVSSPRSKGKQKPRSSFFASCVCCTTATN